MAGSRSSARLAAGEFDDEGIAQDDADARLARDLERAELEGLGAADGRIALRRRAHRASEDGQRRHHRYHSHVTSSANAAQL